MSITTDYLVGKRLPAIYRTNTSGILSCELTSIEDLKDQIVVISHAATGYIKYSLVLSFNFPTTISDTTNFDIYLTSMNRLVSSANAMITLYFNSSTNITRNRIFCNNSNATLPNSYNYGNYYNPSLTGVTQGVQLTFYTPINTSVNLDLDGQYKESHDILRVTVGGYYEGASVYPYLMLSSNTGVVTAISSY